MAADIDIEIDIDIDIEIDKDIDKDNEKDKVTDMEIESVVFEKCKMQNVKCRIIGALRANCNLVSLCETYRI